MDYEELVQEALRSVVFKVLKATEQFGLIEPHHFYILFQVNYPGVEVPDLLKEEDSEEATIILQHQFWNLKVTEKDFSVVLLFNNTTSNIRIPFKALLSFVDPSAKFGLQFTPPSFQSHSISACETSNPSVATSQAGSPPNVIRVDFHREK